MRVRARETIFRFPRRETRSRRRATRRYFYLRVSLVRATEIEPGICRVARCLLCVARWKKPAQIGLRNKIGVDDDGDASRASFSRSEKGGERNCASRLKFLGITIMFNGGSTGGSFLNSLYAIFSIQENSPDDFSRSTPVVACFCI